MLKKIVPVMCLVILLSGCTTGEKNTVEDSNKSTTVNIDISSEDIHKYIDVGNSALSKVDVDDATLRSVIKSQAIYKEILKEEGSSILRKINVTNEEVKAYITNPNNPIIMKTVVLKDSDGSDWEYYITKEDPLMSKSIKIGDIFMGSKVSDVHDTTTDEKASKAREYIASGVLADTVTKYVDECMNLRSGK